MQLAEGNESEKANNKEGNSGDSINVEDVEDVDNGLTETTNYWKLKKEQKKQKKQTEKAARREQVLGQFSEAELAEYDQKHAEYAQARIREARERKLAAHQKLASATPIIVDIETYHEMMLEKEIKSVWQQLLFCYGSTCKVENPYRLVCCGLNEADMKHFNTMQGFENWDADFYTEGLKEVVENKMHKSLSKDCIYLTGDTDRFIDVAELHRNAADKEKDKIYIIGGLVDKNRHKFASLKRAQQLGIPVECVPIANWISVTGRTIISINQICNLMNLLHSGVPCREACWQSIPGRRLGADESALKEDK